MKIRFFIFSLCVGFVMGAGASPCKKPFQPETEGEAEPSHLTEGSSSTTLPSSKIPPSRILSSSLEEQPPEGTNDMTTLERDAVGGAVTGLALDAVTGEEISAARYCDGCGFRCGNRCCYSYNRSRFC